MLRRHVLPALGAARLDTIRALQIETDVIRPLREAGKLRTAVFVKAVLSKVMKSATKDSTLGLVANPCWGVEAGRRPRREMHPLDAVERAALREAIRGTPYEVLWLLMMLTGLGPGEALGLGWEHLDLDAGSLRVARTLDCKRRELIDDTKRESRKRVVPLGAELRKMLAKRWMAAGRSATELVFTNTKGRSTWTSCAPCTSRRP